MVMGLKLLSFENERSTGLPRERRTAATRSPPSRMAGQREASYIFQASIPPAWSPFSDTQIRAVRTALRQLRRAAGQAVTAVIPTVVQ